MRRFFIPCFLIFAHLTVFLQPPSSFDSTFEAAQQRDTDAQFNLRALYYKVEDVHQNKIQTKEYFWKACDGSYQPRGETYQVLNTQS